MELVFDGYRVGSLLCNLIRNGLDGSLGFRDGGLGATKNDSGDFATIQSFVNVDLSSSVVLDLVDRSTTTAEDTSDGASGDCKLNLVVVLFLELQGLYGLTRLAKSMMI